MDYSVYVAKTLTIALTKIGPVVGFIIMGYFVFIKLPFLFFRSSLRAGRTFDAASSAPREDFKEDYSIHEYNKFLRRQARLEGGQPKEQKKKEEPKQQAWEERRSEERKAPPKQEKPRPGVSPEEHLFSFEAGQKFSKQELKKRYRDLLKQSHPDKVATEGTQLRKIAEVKSKEINSAYEKLKSRAA